MAVNIGPKIGVDGEAEYRRQINQIIQQSKTLESQMKLVASQFTAATTAEERNAKTASVLSKQIDVQRERVKLLAEQTGKAAAKYGESDEKTQKWQQALNEATATLNKMQSELRNASSGVEELGDDMREGSEKVLSFGDVLKANVASGFIVSGVKAMASAIKEATAALVDLGKQSIMGFAEQEQLIGGVDTLFKESSAQVQQYANDAYKTAGLSANQYMETVTSFSASLLQSLGGDTAAAAQKADQAITDMSDNANKLGTDMTSIQDAYQGFAKQNYTMLDNSLTGASDLDIPTPPEGLADKTYNFTAYYENDVFDARISYNYKDKYVEYIHLNMYPVYRDAYGQTDIALGYQLTDNVKLSLKGINMTDEETTGYTMNPAFPVMYEFSGRRVSLGLRADF